MAKDIEKATPLTPLSEARVIWQASQKKPGVWRYVKWLHATFAWEGSVITVTKEGWVRLGINYDHIKAVKERKAKEDAEIGAPKVRRASSYVRPVGEDGEPLDPFFIVRDRTTQEKRYLQVFPAKVFDLRTKKLRPILTMVYKDGDPVDLMANPDLKAEVESTLKKSKGEASNTFVIKLNNILEIK